MIDNFHIDVTALEREDFSLAVRLAFSQNKSTVGWRVLPTHGLVLFWVKTEGINLFPASLDAEGAADMAWRWLKEADYGPEPDHDGSNSRGWRIYNEDWGHVADSYQAICAVQPEWVMHGK